MKNQTATNQPYLNSAKPVEIPPVESWDRAKLRFPFAFDKCYAWDEATGKGELPSPEEDRLHNFYLPNGLLMRATRNNIPNTGGESLWISFRPSPHHGKDVCCPTSLTMMAGEAMSRILPDHWHHKDFLKTHTVILGTTEFGIQLSYKPELLKEI